MIHSVSKIFNYAMAVAGGAKTRRRPAPLSLSTICRVVFSDNAEEQIKFLQQKNLLPISLTCSCGTQ